MSLFSHMQIVAHDAAHVAHDAAHAAHDAAHAAHDAAHVFVFAYADCCS